MNGNVLKRHVFLVLWYFGWRRAIKLIMSRSRVALNLLMK
jgi:hypothetical protein